MKKFGSEFLAKRVAQCAIFALAGSIGAAYASGSTAFDTLQGTQKSPAASASEWGRQYEKQNKTAQRESQETKLETDNDAPTYSTTYGGSEQGGLKGSGQHSVTTQKPKPQSQKTKEEQFSQTIKPVAYKRVGGQNIAIDGVAPDGAWYQVIGHTETATLPNAATRVAIEAGPKMPEKGKGTLATGPFALAVAGSTANTIKEYANSPKMQQNKTKSNLGAQQQEVADSAAGTGQNGMATAMDAALLPLLNVANEATGTPTSAEAPTKTYNQAVWMVQQIYKYVYIPFAVLLLLPGAVLSNMKGLLAHGVLHAGNDEDAVHPFNGILRSVIAIFLIPATQLFASWCIDVGNSMTYEVAQYVQPSSMMDWVQEQNFSAPLKNAKNALQAPNGGKNAGKLAEVGAQASEVEQQSGATRMMQMAFNLMNATMAIGLLMMSAFQIVMACYLFLMGPIAAAFFAWPAGVGTLFRPVFASWIDAFINVSLWKFWWCVVLLVMQTRIEYLGAGFNMNTTWEMAIYTAFTVILLYVPFSPFEYKPGEMVSQIMSKAEQLKDVGASKGGKKGH